MSKEKVKQETEKIIGRGRKILRYSVNAFIYTLVGIFMLLMILFGISQTSFFKDWLRDTIVETVNESINGKLSIEKIDGTIFTSLIITNTVLADAKNDTVVSANKIELKTSPLKILFKNIYVRKFELADAKIKLIEEQDGNLNLLKIFPSSEEPEDTTSSEFPFTIEVADFKFNNVDFSLQRFDKVESQQEYSSITMEDLQIKDLNVAFSAFADLNKYEYRLMIDNISFNPNFEFFNLKHLSGTILLTPNVAGIKKLHLVTDQSDIELSAGITQIDFLNDFSAEKLGQAPLRFSLTADKMNFEEITTYVPALEMLSGNIFAKLEAAGTLNDLNVETILFDYENTSLKAKAKLKNLLDADQMFIDMNFNDSYLNTTDLKKLFKGLTLPDLTGFGVIKFDTLNYSGNPQNFNSTFALTTKKGNLNGNAALDFTKPDMVYSINLFTKRVDLSPFISIPTNINSKITIRGVGTDLQNMKLNVDGNLNDSWFGQSFLEQTFISTAAQDGILKSIISIQSDSLFVRLITNMDFTSSDDPVYEVTGKVNQLNLGKLLDNESLNSELSLNLAASGQGFNPDSMDLFLVTDIKNSHFSDFNVDSTRLILDIRRNDNGKKIINLISDIADLTLSGDYSITSLGDVFSKESKAISTVIDQKLGPIFYPDSLIDNQAFTDKDFRYGSINSFSIDYLIDFKEQLKINFGNNQIELDGLISGNVNSFQDSLNFDMKAYFNYLKFWNQKDLYFAVNTEIKSKLSNHINNFRDGKIDAFLKLFSERIYAGANIYNLSSEIYLLNDRLNFITSADYEDKTKAKIVAVANFNSDTLILKINSLDLLYNKFKITNRNPLLISYSDNSFSFDDFKLFAADGTITVSGNFGPEGEHNAKLLVENFSGKRIAEDLFNVSPQKNFKSDIELSGNFSGNFSDPKFTLSANINDIYFANGSFGSLVSNFDYEDNSLNTDIKFLDSLKNYENPQLIVAGKIPLNLSSQKDTTLKTKGGIDLTIQSDEYNLSSLAGVIPYLEFKSGKLETDIYLSGTISKPIAIGYFSIKDSKIKVKNNNLNYDLNTKIWIDDEVITLENIELKNEFGTKYGGVLKGNGTITLKNFLLDSTYITLNGDLKVLDQISRTASPMVFGDLALKTRGDIIYNSHRGKSYLLLPIDVTVAELTVPLASSAYSSSSDFIYRYYDFSTGKDKLMMELDSLIMISTQTIKEEKNGNEAVKFDYTVDIKLDTEAEITINLSKKLDQNLDLVLVGDFFIESVEGKSRSGGALKLVEGSKLSFIKSFDARGEVSFEKLDNPIVDITATYRDYYYPLETQNGTASSEQEVAVKIKLKGPLSELNKNFISDENNVGVYIGRQAIEEDKKDQSKSASDAIFFIITGKFTDGASQQDRNAVASTATSLAGSVIGGVLNKYFDDYIKGFQLRQTATDTRFSLIGKAGDFRYEIGGSTDVLQDLSRANIKIEYPVTRRLQLRLERKESENQLNSINSPLFNELGMKYNFEF